MSGLPFTWVTTPGPEVNPRKITIHGRITIPAHALGFSTWKCWLMFQYDAQVVKLMHHRSNFNRFKEVKI